MKNRPLPFRLIEWWVMSILFITIILTNIFITDFHHFNPSEQRMASYFAKILIPIILFLSFYLHHQILQPTKESRKNKFMHFVYSGLILLVSFISVGGLSILGKISANFSIPFYFSSVGLYVGYLLLSHVLDQAFESTKTENYLPFNLLKLGTIFLFSLLFLFGFIPIVAKGIIAVYALTIPLALVTFVYNYFLIYGNRKKNLTRRANYLYALLIVLVAMLFFLLAASTGQEEFLVVGLAVTLFVVIVLIPLSNLLFKRYDHMLGQIHDLSYQVGKGSADLSFLRMQINPHFLFNVLNTLYGTALQEKAERTSEGIQKLGDMMRFMLHENSLDMIPIAKEKEYLVNYVDLQVLRIKSHPNIEIDFRHGQGSCLGDMAPMLLIPFVENAFKHGISFQKKSWVKISLRCNDGVVHLDVNNSIHRADEQDPESKSSGIGLANVKQRLKLIYPDRHELVIRENEVEYFVHLTIQTN